MMRALDVNYFMWMLCSLAFYLTIRRLGYYANRSMLESFLPAQITTFSLGGIKMMCYTIQLYLYGSDLDTALLIVSALIAGIAFAVASSFLQILQRLYNESLVLGTFYLWNICYSIPLALWVMCIGVNYTQKEYIVISVAFVLIGGVMCASIIKRNEYMPLDKDLGRENARASQDIESQEMDTIDLKMEDENEIIDEESLIVNIKNI